MQISKSCPPRHAISLIEILFVLSIISVVLSIALPAVNGARESARRVSCINRLRQLGLGLQNFESAHGQYPSDGWGWGWVGDAGTKHGLDGPGGWAFDLLPFLEHEQLWQLTQSDEGRLQSLQTPIPLLVCPSRRDAKPFPYTQQDLPLRNCETPSVGSRTDFAICGGDQIVGAFPGPPSEKQLGQFGRPDQSLFSGISFVRSTIRPRDVSDGLSHTVSLGEKSLSRFHYESGESLGDDQTALIGDDADIRRWTEFSPRRDSEVDDIESFGSAHAPGLHVAFCDGAVQTVGYQVDLSIWKSMGNRSDTSRSDR